MKIMQQNNVKIPTQEQVKTYISQWHKLENYINQEKALNKLFKELLPKNDKFEDVLLKVTVLNKFYSTKILDTYSLSKKIGEIKYLDDRLKNGDKSLVDEISTIDEQKRSFYSFASKYCNHHNEEAFPIFDSFVEKVIMYLIINDNETIIKSNNISKEMKTLLSSKITKSRIQAFLREKYKNFTSVLTDIRHVYKLENVSYSDFDKFLWLWGKDMFVKQFKKK
jgi:hypothetical protein